MQPFPSQCSSTAITLVRCRSLEPTTRRSRRSPRRQPPSCGGPEARIRSTVITRATPELLADLGFSPAEIARAVAESDVRWATTLGELGDRAGADGPARCSRRPRLAVYGTPGSSPLRARPCGTCLSRGPASPGCGPPRTRARDRPSGYRIGALRDARPPSPEAPMKSILVVSPYGSEHGPRRTLEHVVRAVTLAGFRPVCVVPSPDAISPELAALEPDVRILASLDTLHRTFDPRLILRLVRAHRAAVGDDCPHRARRGRGGDLHDLRGRPCRRHRRAACGGPERNARDRLVDSLPTAARAGLRSAAEPVFVALRCVLECRGDHAHRQRRRPRHDRSRAQLDLARRSGVVRAASLAAPVSTAQGSAWSRPTIRARDTICSWLRPHSSPNPTRTCASI